jgi:ATP-binding cassette, subfamily B, bacterial
VLWVELSNLNVIRFQQEIATLSQGSRGIEHHERPDYADELELLRNSGNPLNLGIEYSVYGAAMAVRLVLTVVLIAQVEPTLLILVIFGIPTLVAGRLVTTTMRRAYEETASESRRAQHILDLSLRSDAGAETRIFGLGDELHRRLTASRDSINKRMMRARRRAMLLNLGGHTVFAAAYVIALVLVVRSAVNGHKSLGDVVLVVTLTAQINTVVAQSVGTSGFLQRCAQAYLRLTWLRDLIERLYPQRPAPLQPPARLDTGIALRNVTFSYPGTDKPVLRDVDLDLPAGATVAFVGDNGAGKSTLVKLLCRLYEPTEGQILVDGIPLSAIAPETWRTRISAAFQDFLRLEFDLRLSVGLGDLDRLDDDAAVAGALARANAADLIDRLQHGLDTPLGMSMQDGVELSGGQWQKIALARAMMRENPLLLVLDEPTSALDAHSEHALFERYAASAQNVGEATGGITIFVSHRFSTVRMADLIVVIDDGRIAETGSHDELLELDGIYAELFKLQAAAFA